MIEGPEVEEVLMETVGDVNASRMTFLRRAILKMFVVFGGGIVGTLERS